MTVTDIKREWKVISPGKYRCGPYLIQWERGGPWWEVYWHSGGAPDFLAGEFQTIGAVRRWLMDNWRRLETEEESGG